MTRFRVETILAALCAGLAVLTTIWPDWIELFGWNPDHGDGSVEWAVVITLGLAALVLTVLARREFRRMHPVRT